MMEKLIYAKFHLASFWFFLLQIIVLAKLYIAGSFEEIFYFCYHAPLLFAIAFYRKDVVIIRALIVIGLIGQSVWMFDYLYYLLTGQFVLGVSVYMSRYVGFLYFSTLSAHAFSSLLALALIYNEEISIKSAVYAFVYFAVIYTLSLLNIIPTVLNVNFIVRFRGVGTLPYHTQLYLIYILLLSVIPGYSIQKLIKKTCISGGGDAKAEIPHPLSV